MHGAYNLVKKQTKEVISKVCCLAHESVTNDLVKKTDRNRIVGVRKQRQKNKPMNEQCSWLVLPHFPVTQTVWFSRDPKRLRNKRELEENANVLILGTPISWLFTIYKSSEKSGWKVNRTRLFGSAFQRKISGSNGTSEKLVLFSQVGMLQTKIQVPFLQTHLWYQFQLFAAVFR